MIGYWITPKGEMIKVDDSLIEHIEHAYESGWLDEWLNDDPKPEDDSDSFDYDPYYDWQNRMKDRLFDQGYARTRHYMNPRGLSDIGIQGKSEYLKPALVKKIIKAHGESSDYPITIETPDMKELLTKGSLLEWARKYAELHPPSDALCKDVYAPAHLLSAIRPRF